MSYRLLGTEWNFGNCETGRHGLPDYIWHAVNNVEGALSIHMATKARFFVSWRSGSSPCTSKVSKAFDTFEDAVEYAAEAFEWLPLKPWVLLDPEGPHFFNFKA